jgi:AcrR family transcriptional regulator
MSPRPRQASDEEILQATFRAVARVGPARLTLADVAEEAGLSASALVQRFGSKRALLLAAAADVATNGGYLFDGVRAQYPSPVEALLGLAECMTLMGSTPDEVANTLSFQQMDLSDRDFQRQALAASRGTHGGLRALVADAVEAGELVGLDPDRLASVLQATINGSLLGWAIHRDGDLPAWIRLNLETVLAPYRARRS